MRTMFLAFLSMMMFPLSGFCGTDLTSDQVKKITEINTKIGVVRELVDRKVISPAVGSDADALFCGDAEKVVGHKVTPQDVQTLAAKGEKTEGLGVVKIFFVVVAGILILLGGAFLTWHYFGAVLLNVPATVYEVFAYIATAGMCLLGFLIRPFELAGLLVEPLWFVVPGALALAGCIYLTRWLHFEDDERGRDRVYMGPSFISFPTVLFGLCTIAWGSLAVFYHRLFPAAGIPYVLGFASVIALQAFLGFSVLTMPGCIALGWTSNEQVPKSVVSSAMILIAYVTMKVNNAVTGDLMLFESGAIFMGAFVYYLGLLIMSSKYYSWRDRDGGGHYVWMQIVTIASGVAALYVGSVFGVGALLGVGGTFFTIYLLEKYYELPWDGVGWAWSLVGVATFIYFMVGFANTHSQYFIWGIQ